MNVDGTTAENHPRYFTDIHIEYVITGRDISEDAVKRSINLSLDKYCMVGTTIKKAANITYSYKIIQEA
jgi:putative redox protein